MISTANTTAADSEPAELLTSPLDEVIANASETILNTLSTIINNFLAHLPLLIAGLLLLVLTALLAWLSKAISWRVLKRVSAKRSFKTLIVRFVGLAIWGIGLMVSAIVTFPDLTPGRVLAGLGIGSIAVGLAFKDIFENFFAGVLILWRFPFENGDWITCNGITGRVVDTTVRNTMLRTVSGELIVMPNVDLYKNPVDILTDRPKRRIEITCGVTYRATVAGARRVILDAVRRCETVSKNDDVLVLASEFADSSVNFQVVWWTDATPLERRQSQDEVIEAVKDALDANAIEIPFPQRTLSFSEPIPLDGPQNPVSNDQNESAAP